MFQNDVSMMEISLMNNDWMLVIHGTEIVLFSFFIIFFLQKTGVAGNYLDAC